MVKIHATEGRYLRARDIAIILGVATKTVNLWAREAVIPSLRIKPKVVRFDLDAVRLALAGRTACGGKEPCVNPTPKRGAVQDQ